MNLDYQGPTQIKLDRVLPKSPNSCRLSVLANAINFYAGKRLFTPEAVLEDINSQRQSKGESAVDLTKETLQDSEIGTTLKRLAPTLSLIRINGAKYLNLALWKALLGKQFFLVIDHQLVYYDPLHPEKNEIGYLPADLVKRLVYKPEFSYQTFTDLYRFYLHRAKAVSEGHVDIVLDLVEIDGVDSIILANMASYGNEFLIKLPFNFYKNYLAFDWTNEKAITAVNELPSETEFKILRNIGFLKTRQFQFLYGLMEIYYPTNRRGELDQILL
ncbi:hypothetical protein HYU90_02965 [Candidatus Collierbacteria bacterium]|nr:hypothetical protein [Candidatus Collierbacteria bacterium]